MQHRLILTSLLFFCFFSLPSLSEEKYGNTQIHLRGGIIEGSYDGLTKTNLSSVTLFDLEYEVLLSNKKSYFFRSTFGMDYGKNITNYTYIGGGMKFYLGSQGMFFDTSQDNTEIQTFPRWRYFVGAAVGISTVVLKTVGTLLQQNSSNIDIGANAGIIYQVYKRVGVEFQYSYDISTGFTSISVGGTAHRLMFGVTYFL